MLSCGFHADLSMSLSSSKCYEQLCSTLLQAFLYFICVCVCVCVCVYLSTYLPYLIITSNCILDIVAILIFTYREFDLERFIICILGAHNY